MWLTGKLADVLVLVKRGHVCATAARCSAIINASFSCMVSGNVCLQVCGTATILDGFPTQFAFCKTYYISFFPNFFQTLDFSLTGTLKIGLELSDIFSEEASDLRSGGHVLNSRRVIEMERAW